MGLFCLGAIPLFVSDIVPVDWWQYGITIAFSSLFLYRGLSREGSERDRVFREYFKETALSMYGPLYSIKVNLPWILIFIFFPSALFLRLVFLIWIPTGVALAFVLILAISAVYSIGIINDVKGEIEKLK
jgi:hypothetical protein